jgi:hypothetical protein
MPFGPPGIHALAESSGWAGIGPHPPSSRGQPARMRPTLSATQAGLA